MLPKLPLVPDRGDLHQAVEALAFTLVPVGLALLSAAGLVDLDRNAGSLGQHTNGLAKGVPLDPLEEREYVAALLAAEAMVETRVGIDVEARRLFLVKGAQPDEPAAALFQRRHALRHDSDDVGAVPDDGYGVLRDHRQPLT